MKREITLKSTNGKDNLHVIIWEPEGECKGIVQISHGMEEYVDRFDNLALKLNAAGYLCIGNDHIGHGLTAASREDLGYFGDGLSKTVVDDLKIVTDYAKETYGKDISYCLFGHSMGSFMARRYAMSYGNELTALILSGTGYTPNAIVGLGRIVATLVGAVKTERCRSKLLKTMAFGAYNKRIENAKTTHDWLTRDEEEVKKYLASDLCAFSFTVNGYKTLFDVLTYIQKDSNVANIPAKLPIYMISGKEDPVGNYGAGVRIVYDKLVDTGHTEVEMKLYDNDRHELTNELDKEQVFADIISWLDGKMK